MNRIRGSAIHAILALVASTGLWVYLGTKALADGQDSRVARSAGKAENNVNGGRVGTATKFRVGTNAWNSNANPRGDGDSKEDKYATATSPFSATAAARGAADGCRKWAPSASSTINWAAGKWDSDASSATVVSLGTAQVAESADASSVVSDPDSFIVHFAPGTPDPRVTIDLTIAGGLDQSELITRNQTGLSTEFTEARLNGFTICSLLTGSVFNYDWRATSSDPSLTTFSFSSNPALGLNDAAVMADFLSKVSNPDPGHFVLTSDVVVSATVPVTPDINGDVVFTLGGETSYQAAANPSVTGVPTVAATVRFALRGLRPNPSHGGALIVAFSLATSGPATLRLYDLRGRIASHYEASLGPGEHLVQMPRSELSPGIYWLKLTQRGQAATTKAIVLR